MSAPFFARLFLVLAALIVIARAACAIFGLEDHLAIVSGATPSSPLALLLGIAFVVIHLLFVIVAPILALAAGLIAACVPITRVPRRPAAVP